MNDDIIDGSSSITSGCERETDSDDSKQDILNSAEEPEGTPSEVKDSSSVEEPQIAASMLVPSSSGR